MSQRDHGKDLAAIRSELHANKVQLEESHAAEIQSLTASHAVGLAGLKTEHASALGVLQLELDSARDFVKANEAPVQDTIVSDHLKEEIERLNRQLEAASVSEPRKSGNAEHVVIANVCHSNLWEPQIG